MKTFSDNYTSTVRTVAKCLLAMAPAGLRVSDKLRLEAIVEGDMDSVGSYLGLEFRRELADGAEAQVFLSVDFKRVYDGSGSWHEDSEGNRWVLFDLQAQLNWPSWGTSRERDHSITRARLALMSEVQQLAENLEAVVAATLSGSPIAQMVETKAERAAALKHAATRVLATTLGEMGACKGLRVGSYTTVQLPADKVELLRDAFTDGVTERFEVKVKGKPAHFVARDHLVVRCICVSRVA